MSEYDVIVVGTGAAGLFSALALPANRSILMITKDAVANSDSYLAQGGISALKEPEDYDTYFEDTMRAGRYENRKESVKVMIEDSPAIIEDLIRYGVEFERYEDGSLCYTREGAHSTFRILYHKDETGREITSKLIEAAGKRSNITIMEYTTMLDLLEQKNQCCGIVAEYADGVIAPIYSKCVVLATGGLGGLFPSSTNFSHITGDSFAIALQHQIELENINYIQIHPTTLYSKKKGRRFLISESVRGEGAILLNENKERFVDELLPRDVVTAAIKKELEAFGTDHVYLSLAHMTKEEMVHRFPNIYDHCLEEGYDPATDLVPVTPAQHYLMGGIKTNTRGETSLKCLYAVGETACNGVHGANRLASNSLLESLVFAKRAADLMNQKLNRLMLLKPQVALPFSYNKEDRLKNDRAIIMSEIQRRDEKFYAKWCNNEN